jgi:hypothetical protein
MKRYLIDKLAADLLENTEIAIRTATKYAKKPIQSVVLWHDTSETFIPHQALVSFKPGAPRGPMKTELTLSIPKPRSSVPQSLIYFEDEGDPVRDEFIRIHKLSKQAEWWGEVLSVPRLLVVMEIDRVMVGLKERLQQFGIKLAPKFAVYNGDPDKIEPLEREGSMDDAIRDDLRAKLKTPAQKRAFVEICYKDPERQRWLLALAGA